MSSLGVSRYQGGISCEVFTPQGSNPTSNCKLFGSKGIQKVYDRNVKGFVYDCHGGPSCKLQLPKDEQKTGLHLVQPYLVLQIMVSGNQHFAFELSICDTTGTRRKLYFSTSFSEIKLTPLHSQLPLNSVKRDVWLNLALNIPELVTGCFRGLLFRSLEAIVISSVCKLRKIFTMRSRPLGTGEAAEAHFLLLGTGEVIPADLAFTPGVDFMTQVLDISAVQEAVHPTPASQASDAAAGKRRNSTGAAVAKGKAGAHEKAEAAAEQRQPFSLAPNTRAGAPLTLVSPNLKSPEQPDSSSITTAAATPVHPRKSAAAAGRERLHTSSSGHAGDSEDNHSAAASGSPGSTTSSQVEARVRARRASAADSQQSSNGREDATSAAKTTSTRPQRTMAGAKAKANPAKRPSAVGSTAREGAGGAAVGGAALRRKDAPLAERERPGALGARKTAAAARENPPKPEPAKAEPGGGKVSGVNATTRRASVPGSGAANKPSSQRRLSLGNEAGPPPPSQTTAADDASGDASPRQTTATYRRARYAGSPPGRASSVGGWEQDNNGGCGSLDYSSDFVSKLNGWGPDRSKEAGPVVLRSGSSSHWRSTPAAAESLAPPPGEIGAGESDGSRPLEGAFDPSGDLSPPVLHGAAAVAALDHHPSLGGRDSVASGASDSWDLEASLGRFCLVPGRRYDVDRYSDSGSPERGGGGAAGGWGSRRASGVGSAALRGRSGDSTSHSGRRDVRFGGGDRERGCVSGSDDEDFLRGLLTASKRGGQGSKMLASDPHRDAEFPQGEREQRTSKANGGKADDAAASRSLVEYEADVMSDAGGRLGGASKQRPDSQYNQSDYEGAEDPKGGPRDTSAPLQGGGGGASRAQSTAGAGGSSVDCGGDSPVQSKAKKKPPASSHTGQPKGPAVWLDGLGGDAPTDHSDLQRRSDPSWHASASSAGPFPSVSPARGSRVSSSEGDGLYPQNGGNLDLLYDPILNCYYDPKTNSYYELK